MYRSSALACPACGATLSAATVASPVQGCARCGGAWLDSESAVAVMRGSDESASRRLAVAATVPSPRETAATAGHERACPACGIAMTSFTLGEVVLDMCPAHGTWFDHEEVARVVSFAAEQNAARRRAESGEDRPVLPTAEEALGAARIMIGAASLPFRAVAVVLEVFWDAHEARRLRRRGF